MRCLMKIFLVSCLVLLCISPTFSQLSFTDDQDWNADPGGEEETVVRTHLFTVLFPTGGA